MKNRTREEKVDLLLPIICALIYVSSYFGRHSYTSNITQIVAALGVSYSDTGLVSTMFFFAYGVGQFVHGIFCNKYSEKYVIPAVLAVSATINLLVFFGIDFNIYKYLWLLNGACLSVLWPFLVRILSKYLSGKAVPRGIVLITASATVGYCFTYLFSAIFSAFKAYKLSFLFASALLIACGVIWVVVYNRLGLVNIGIKLDSEKAEAVKTTVPTHAKPQKNAAFILLLVAMSIYAITTNTIKDGLHVWVPSVLKDSFELPESMSTFLSITLSIFGMFAAMLSVKIHSKVKNYLLEVELISILAGGLVLAIIGLIGNSHLILTLICFGAVALLMHTCCSTLTGIAPMELKDKMDSGALAGILNGSCYVGSVIASYALGIIADNFGWISVFYFLLILSVIPAGVLLVKLAYRGVSTIIKR